LNLKKIDRLRRIVGINCKRTGLMEEVTIDICLELLEYLICTEESECQMVDSTDDPKTLNLFVTSAVLKLNPVSINRELEDPGAVCVPPFEETTFWNELMLTLIASDWMS